MSPETPTKQSAELQQRQALVDELLNTGDLEGLITAAKARAQELNRAAHAELTPPPAQPGSDFAARIAWAHDGQAIYGELKEFAWAAYRAAAQGDQVTYSQQRDLLYKAVLTAVGAPPAEETQPAAGQE